VAARETHQDTIGKAAAPDKREVRGRRCERAPAPVAFSRGQQRRLEMTTVREAAFDLFRARGMTTIFGNPGSTELPMLAEFPDDFRYVLGLHEMVAVGMADGFAQASGAVAHVNLHTAPGVGNAIGAIFNARANRAPLLVTAGQQARSMMTMGATLTNRDATVVPQPFVKWSYEPPRAQDVPFALAQAINHASLPPAGPAFVSIPMDDWRAEVEPADYAAQTTRRVSGRSQLAAAEIAALARRLEAAQRPVFVAGPDIDASGGWEAAIELVERRRMAVWASPPTGGARIGFPEDHPAFQGVLPPAVAPIAQALEGHDLILVAGSAVFPYYPNIPGDFLPAGAQLVAITSDPDEAARAPVGEAFVADVALALRALADELTEVSDGETPAPRAAAEVAEEAGALSSSAVHATLARVFPPEGIVVLESPSSTAALRNQLRLSRPGSYYFSASGGLGFAISAALGVQLAQPQRQVVCVLGEGSAQYAITALWTAAAYAIGVKFLVLRNSDYSILKWFSALEGIEGAPGLDLPALDVAATAESYGVAAVTVSERDALQEALEAALAQDGPRLVQVDVAPGMAVA
jgi:benzoylformate decarboxylase